MTTETTTTARCTYVEYGCTSGKAPIGPVFFAGTDEVAFVMESCEDCMADQSYSDWYKEQEGIRPRWMSREERIEAWWALPESGERPA